MGLNITENINSREEGLVRSQAEEETENSSSFDETFSGDEDASASGDAEAESRPHDFDDITTEFDELCRMPGMRYHLCTVNQLSVTLFALDLRFHEYMSIYVSVIRITSYE